MQKITFLRKDLRSLKQAVSKTNILCEVEVTVTVSLVDGYNASQKGNSSIFYTDTVAE